MSQLRNENASMAENSWHAVLTCTARGQAVRAGARGDAPLKKWQPVNAARFCEAADPPVATHKIQRKPGGGSAAGPWAWRARTQPAEFECDHGCESPLAHVVRDDPENFLSKQHLCIFLEADMTGRESRQNTAVAIPRAAKS